MESIRIFRWNKIIHCKTAFYTPPMQALLADLDSAFETPLKILKNDIASSVVIVKIDERYLVVKRSNTKNWIHFIRRLFLQTRARKNWNFAHELLRKNINTFEPVAFAEERYGPLRGRSYFISSYIEGKDLRYYFANAAVNQTNWKKIISNVACLFQNLTQHGFIHRDLSLGNIILLDNQPWLIDFDSMRRYRSQRWSKRAAKRQLERFIDNCKEVPQITSEIILAFQSIFNE